MLSGTSMININWNMRQKKIDAFKWLITTDVKDYKAGGHGCYGVCSIIDEPVRACPSNRSHGLKNMQKSLISKKPALLGIGK
jgi:hypothetical protein